MRYGAVLRDGALIGSAGALALAAWLLVMDLAAGHAFFTPAALGAGLFQGARNVDAMPASAGALVAAYTAFHFAVFILAGLAVAFMAHAMEREPQLFFMAFFAPFAFFQIAYITFAQLFVTRVLPNMSWSALLIGDVLVCAAMAVLLYVRHPLFRVKLTAGEPHPLR